MAYLQQIELNILMWIQSFSTPALDVIWQCITMLGEETWMVLAFCYIYWCYRKDMALFLSFTLFTSLTCNSLLKNMFRLPRPIGEPGIRVLREHTATGFSFPSGHSQLGATAFAGLSYWYGKKKYFFGAVIVSLLIGYSRMYLGVHYPKDVVVGLLLGWGISYLCYLLYRRVKKTYGLFFVTWLFSLGCTFFFPDKTAWQCLGLFTGFVLGSWVEDRFVQFNPGAGSRLRKLYRWILGICGILGIKLLLEQCPDTVAFYVGGYFFLAFYMYCLYPLIFQKLRL